MSEVFNITARLNAVDNASSTLAGAAQKTQRSMGQMATGMGMVATSGLLLYSSFDNISTAQTKYASAQAGVTSAQVGVERATLALNRAIEKYGEDSDEATLRSLDLRRAQETLTTATLRFDDAQDVVNKAIAQFALTIVPAAMTAVGGMTNAMKGMGLASNTKLVPSLGRAGIAFRGLMVSMGPIGLALIAITAAVAILALAWDQNWGDIRGKTAAAIEFMRGLWENYLLPALEFIGNVATALAEKWAGAWSWMTSAIQGASSAIRGAIDWIIDAARTVLELLAKIIKFSPAGLIAQGLSAATGIKIPGLQRGGIVTQPTLAVLGERGPAIPEAVVPLNRLSEFAQGPRRITLEVPVGVFRELVDELLLGLEHKSVVTLSGVMR